LSYEIFDLILELPEFSPKWTEQDILQFITESTDGTIENIEIISFSTTQKFTMYLSLERFYGSIRKSKKI